MKKVFLTVLVALVSVTLFAEDLPKQGFGIQLGWAQPILRLNDPLKNPKDSLANTTRLLGLKVGLTYDASYWKGFGSSIGINYTFGAAATPWEKKSARQPGEYPQVRSHILYNEVEMFVDWQYKFEVAKETYLILYTGPTLQCGITYNSSREEKDLDGILPSDGDVINRYKTDVPDLQLTRLNITWGVGAGFQYKRYFLRGGYDFGLINPYKNRMFETSKEDRYTRGRFDQWAIKIGAYIWYED